MGDKETTENKERRKDTEVGQGDEAENVSGKSDVSRVRLTVEISETQTNQHDEGTRGSRKHSGNSGESKRKKSQRKKVSRRGKQKNKEVGIKSGL